MNSQVLDQLKKTNLDTVTDLSRSSCAKAFAGMAACPPLCDALGTHRSHVNLDCDKKTGRSRTKHLPGSLTLALCQTAIGSL